jgi:AcrR family transcriptional regulator
MRAELSTCTVDDMVIHDVTERADVALGTFYNHFADKAAGLNALAELESRTLRRQVLELVDNQVDVARWVTSTAVVLVQRAAIDPGWIAAMESIVNAQLWPSQEGLAFHLALVSNEPNHTPESARWAVEVFQSLARGLVRHLGDGAFSGSVADRLQIVIPSMLGPLGLTTARIDRELEFAVAVPLRTEWPNSEDELLNDDTLAHELGLDEVDLNN